MRSSVDARDLELIERAGELAAFSAAASRVAGGGDGSLVIVEGPAGIGKSRLLEAFGELAGEAGLRVLAARGSEAEREFGHGVARQLFERELAAATAAGRRRLLAGAAAHAAPVVTPAAVPATPADDRAFAVVHGLYWLVANLAEDGPLVLRVDDAHWADGPSLAFLGYLARRLEGLPVLLAVAARPREPGSELALLAELELAAATRLMPRPLTEGGCAHVIERALGEAATREFVASCAASSGGNPFLLHELLAALAADGIAPGDDAAEQVRALGPETVSRSLLLRLGRLPDGAVALGRAVAVLGDDVELRDAAALAGLDDTVAAGLADALADVDVLAARRPLSFAHPVLRQAVLSDIPLGERAALHAGAARVLAAAGAELDPIASQLLAAEPAGDPWVVETLRQAAREATARGAAEPARHYLQRALREPPVDDLRADVLLELGRLLWLSGDLDTGTSCLREAVDGALAPDRRAEATLQLARALLAANDVVAGTALLEAGIERGRGDGASRDSVMRLEAELVGGAIAVGAPGVEDWVARFDAVPGDTGPELLQLCLVAGWRWIDGTAEQAVQAARRALAGGRLLELESSQNYPAIHTMFALTVAGEVAEAHAWNDAAIADARRRGSATWASWYAIGHAYTCWFEGDVRGCEMNARFPDDSGLHPSAEPIARMLLALALTERGELAEADRALEGICSPDLPVVNYLNWTFYARGLLRLAQGRDEEGLADLRECGARAAAVRMRNPCMPWRVAAARALLQLGRDDEARALAAEQDELARHWGSNAALGVARHAQALIGDGPARLAALEEAVALLERSPARLDRARALLDLGGALRRAGRRNDAQARLRAALELAHSIGATTLAEQAGAELVVAGGRPRRLMFSGVDALTPGELRVARLAAEGMTNRDIAQALYVTPKTVENHLGRVYGKLGIASRTALADALEPTPQDGS